MPFGDPNDYELPQSARDIIPAELGQDFLSTLDESFQRQEKKQLERLLDEQESRGFFRSGDTQRRLLEEVLGPSLERRKQSLIPLALEGARTGQAQRFQRESDTIAFERQLKVMERQREIQENLMRLGAWLEENARQPADFGSQFTSSFASGLGSSLGKLPSQGVQKVFGGFGSLGISGGQ